MAFQQGLSGLNTSSKALDVTSNNIANASTVGFKGASTHFADVYAASLSGGGASQVGIGVSPSAIVQQYTQGNITTTSNSLDIAINGNGFFRLSQDGAVTYSRNGQFHIDANGFLVNDTQDNVTGYIADDAGLITASTPESLRISTRSIDPVATGASGSARAGVFASLQLDSTQATKPWVTPTSATQAPNTSTYNYSTALTIYDSLGNPHSMTMYFTKDAVAGTDAAGTTGAWNVHYQVDGVNGESLAPSMGATRLNFNDSGALISPTTASGVNIDLTGVMTANGLTNSAASPLSFTVDYRDSTQFGAKFSVNELTQDGYTSGNLAGLSIGPDGVIQGNYSNGQTKNLAQIVLANFTNPNGLMSVGNNAWIETASSGQPKVGTPDTGTLGVLQSGAVEESNVDLTGELVNMIVQQRNYQANAQSIKTQDQIMQTLVNIR